MNFDSQIILAALAAIFGLIAYFGKRVLSQEKLREKAGLYTSYASIAATMKSQNLTLYDMESIAKYLNVGKQTKRMIENAEKDKDANASDVAEGSEYWTQSAMNARAHASEQTSAAKLNELVVEYRTLIEVYNQEVFDQLQENWENYRDTQAMIEASQAEGGSMQPLLLNSEKSDLNNQRIIAIEAMIAEQKKRSKISTN